LPVFISYSHDDKLIVNKLAAHLVKHNANVWVDTWELNVGDSIITKVQEAIEGSSALLVMLSESSVGSEWCKKELTAGLMRELEEKRVVVLPVLLEDCQVPIFLRDKMYADLRGDFDSGLHSIIEAIAKVTNADQGRIEQDDGYVDWSVDWGYRDTHFELRFTLIETHSSMPLTLLTEVSAQCNEVVTDRYEQYVEAGLDWFGRVMLTEALYELGEKKNLNLIINSSFPQELNAGVVDEKTGAKYEIKVRSRRLGQDNGKDQLVRVSSYLKNIRDYMRNTSREPSKEELQKVIEIMRTPFGT
jgi:hypothetical protein